MKKTTTPLGEILAQGLRDAIAFERGDKSVKMRITEVEMPAAPPRYGREDVQRIREKVLHLSQAAFARLLNVSPRTVQSWEHGLRRPAQSAARLLQFIEQPELLLERLRSGLKRSEPAPTARERKHRTVAAETKVIRGTARLAPKRPKKQ